MRGEKRQEVEDRDQEGQGYQEEEAQEVVEREEATQEREGGS